MAYFMSKVYETVDEESASRGDFKECGFVYKKQAFESLDDMAREIRDNGALAHSGGRYYNEDEETCRQTGASTMYSFLPELTELFDIMILHLLVMHRN